MRGTASRLAGRLVALVPLVLMVWVGLSGVAVAAPPPFFLHHLAQHHHMGHSPPHAPAHGTVEVPLAVVHENAHAAQVSAHAHATHESARVGHELVHDSYKAPAPAHSQEKIVIQVNPDTRNGAVTGAAVAAAAAAAASAVSATGAHPAPPPQKHHQPQAPTHGHEGHHAEIKCETGLLQEQRPRPHHASSASGKAVKCCSVPPPPSSLSPSNSEPVIMELKVTETRRGAGRSSSAESDGSLHVPLRRSHLFEEPGEEWQSDLPGVGMLSTAEHAMKGKLGLASAAAASVLEPFHHDPHRG